jgi:Zn-dependent protease
MGKFKGFFPHYYKGLSQSAYWWMGIIGAGGLFLSIIFHEFCHSLVARKFGLFMKGITLFIFGSVAEMEPGTAERRDRVSYGRRRVYLQHFPGVRFLFYFFRNAS